ncbi:MAG: STAS domain-containing protein [bacterium]
MRLETQKKGQILIVRLLESRLDAAVSIDFKNKMAQYIKNGNHTILLNIAKIEFIDSSGLGAIVTTFKLLGRQRGMAICGAIETVKSMFKLTRMDKVFQIYDNEKEAITALSTNKLFAFN